MYNEELEALISAALADGVLTEKEKQILFKKAEAIGIDLDEFEMVLAGRLAKRKEEMDQLRKEEKAAKERKRTEQKERALRELDSLIQKAMVDGIISSQKRDTIISSIYWRNVSVFNCDGGAEINLYIDAKIEEANKAIEEERKKNKGRCCPYCGEAIPDATDKCPHCDKSITPTASKEFEEVCEQLEDALVNFKSGDADNISKSKAEVERYVRKAKMYFGNNPKVKQMLDEIKKESDTVDREMKKNARNKFLVNFASRYKWLIICVIVFVILAIVGGVYYHNYERKNNPAFICNEVESLVKDNKFAEAEALMVAYAEKKGTHVYEDVLKNGTESLKNGLIENGDYESVLNSNVIRCSYGGDSFGWGSLSNMYPVLLECIKKMKGNKSVDEIKSFIDIHIDEFSSKSSYMLESEWKEGFLDYKNKLYKAAGIK